MTPRHEADTSGTVGRPTRPMNPIQARTFILAGHATVTLRSLTTGTHYTYRVTQTEFDPQRYFAALLTGPDNTQDFTYLGMIRDAGRRTFLNLTAKSKLRDDSPPVLALRFALAHLDQGRIPQGLAIYHEGRCGRCNRTLTVPESIESGFGPECSAIMGLAARHAA